jgi:hypothetical protein
LLPSSALVATRTTTVLEEVQELLAAYQLRAARTGGHDGGDPGLGVETGSDRASVMATPWQ